MLLGRNFVLMQRKLKIIFMGTPEFAVRSLEILIKNGYEVVAVVTAPDKPAGRGMALQESAVKKFSAARNIPVLQPEKLKSQEFINDLRSFQANLQIVVAFRMLPEIVWNMPEYGTFNLHASLLPQYRGAAPINWAIINGEKETGLTTFFLQHEIDTGDIILQEKLSIREDEMAGELHDRMCITGASLVLKTVKLIEANSLHPAKQVFSTELKPAPKIFKDDCLIHWDKPLDDIYNHIRGLSPYPAAWTYLDNKVFKIYKTSKEHTNANDSLPGLLYTDKKTFLKVGVKGGYLILEEIQMEGKRKLTAREFLNGYKIENGVSRLE